MCYELEEEIDTISTLLVHQVKTVQEIRSTLRNKKSSPIESEQSMNELQMIFSWSENTTEAKATKTDKQLNEKIELAFPTLSSVQRNVCRSKALGYTTKDIARLMSLTVHSVNIRRCRIQTARARQVVDTVFLDIPLYKVSVARRQLKRHGQHSKAGTLTVN